MSDTDALARRWRSLWPVETDEETEAAYCDLVARYTQPHRAYHTLDHVADCLRWLDAARHLVARPTEVELAIWFHDAVYDSRRGDNEEQSARLTAVALPAAGLAQETAGSVADLIRLTTHVAHDLSGDAAVLCDIDLSILGAEPAAFAAYEAAIRREYVWVPDEIFRRERARVLAGFLARPRIYHTPYIRDSLERRARENLTTAISSLGIRFGASDEWSARINP